VLTEPDIRERLRNGSLAVFPLDERDISSNGIYIRLGTEFTELPAAPPRTLETLDLPAPPPIIHHRPLGERVVLNPGEVLLVATLEAIALPADLTGHLFPLSTLSRVGVSVDQAMLSPSFTGKATLTLVNFGRQPVALYPGLRIATLSLFATQVFLSKTPVSPVGLDQLTPEEDVTTLRRVLESASEDAKADYLPERPLTDLLSEALSADKFSKGRKLEIFAGELMRSIEGLKGIGSNIHLRAEELDLLVQNDLAVGFWRFLGSPLLVECKNWNRKVAAADIAALEGRLASLGPDVKTTILIAPNGVTGSRNRAGWLKVRELRQRGKLIIVLDRKMLDLLLSGRHPADVIEHAYHSVWLI